MARPNWAEWVDPFGLSGEMTRAAEGVAKAPMVAAQRAFEGMVRSVAFALEGRQVATSGGERTATVARIDEVVPAYAMPTIPGHRYPIWQRLAMGLRDVRWGDLLLESAAVVAEGVSVDPLAPETIRVQSARAEVAGSTPELQRWVDRQEFPVQTKVHEDRLEIRPRRFGRLGSADIAPEVHNGRGYARIEKAHGSVGWANTWLPGLPLAGTVAIDGLPQTLSIDEVRVVDGTVRAQVRITDIELQVDLRGALESLGSDGTRLAAAFFGPMSSG